MAGVPVVPRLQSYYFEWDVGDVLVFPADKHRTYFAIEDDDQHDIHIWIGDDPPSDTAQWWSVAQAQLHFLHGIYGPIYFAEAGQAGDVKIISNLKEEPTTETAP